MKPYGYVLCAILTGSSLVAAPHAFADDLAAPAKKAHPKKKAAPKDADAQMDNIAADSPAAKPTDDELFTRALSNVYASHPRLRAEREALKATDETVNQAVSGFRPDAGLGYSYGRNRGRVNDQNWQYDNTIDRTATVTQPIFNGGTTLAEFKAAKSRVKAERAQLTAVEQQVLYDAVVAYTDVVAKQSVLEVNQANVDVLGKELKATNERFQVGELTRTDTAQSQARYADAKARARQAQGDLESARATFRRVIGYDPPVKFELPPLPPGLPDTLEQARAWAENAEPTLEAALHLQKAANSDIYAQGGTLLPSVALQGSMSRGNGFSGFNRDHNDAVTLNVSIPLYQSGAEWSRVRQAKDLAQQAKFNAFDTRDAVLESAVRAWQDYHTAQAVIESNAQSVKAAQVALDGIRQENMYGARTILDVLNTQQDLFAARLNLVNARVAEKQQAYRLLASVGKLTARDLQLPVELEDPKKHYNDVKYKLIGF